MLTGKICSCWLLKTLFKISVLVHVYAYIDGITDFCCCSTSEQWTCEHYQQSPAGGDWLYLVLAAGTTARCHRVFFGTNFLIFWPTNIYPGAGC